MNNTWVSADFHLGHKNIVLGVSKYENKSFCRNFQTLEEHDSTIINTINKYVKENDTLYCLGDFSLGGRENLKKYRELIQCRNIHLCIGNHDIFVEKNHQFKDGTWSWELFKSIQHRIHKRIGKNYFIMDHYAMRAWDNGSNGSIMLHGDAHGSLKPYERLLQIADDPFLYKTDDFYKQMDVGIDVAYSIYKEYRPFHINEIKEIMKNRINLNVDHH